MNLTFANANMPRPHPREYDRFFLVSDQWIKLRYKALQLNGNHCQCCGNSWTVGNPLQVDHIKPRALYPHLALELSNLQVLCRECNMGKSTVDLTDWRRLEPP